MLKVKRPVDKKFPINSPFGGPPRELKIADEVERQVKPHQGIDFKCPLGTTVTAVAAGRIIRTGYQDEFNKKAGLGLRIMQEFIFEGQRYICCYGHLSGLLISENDDVVEGQEIGLSGMTGHAEGPHLHVQFRKADTSAWLNAEFT